MGDRERLTLEELVRHKQMGETPTIHEVLASPKNAEFGYDPNYNYTEA